MPSRDYLARIIFARRIFYGYNGRMRKARILLILGLWIAALPYLGFPMLWKNILISLSGLVLAYTEYLNFREAKRELEKENRVGFDNFRENQI